MSDAGGVPTRDSAGKPDTVLGVLRAAEGYLAARGIDAPRRSAELLLGHVLELGKLELYLAHDRPLSEAERATLRKLVAERGRGVPIAYLFGEWEFFGLPLFVGPAVLVPRPETEGLVERAIEGAPRDARCIDIGTGSGAIAIALAHERPDVHVVATEVSEAAVAIAVRNVERHGLGNRVDVRCGSYWAPVAGESFDLLISNPPYVDPAQPELLAADVRAHEPAGALFAEGGADAAYRAIVAGAPGHLHTGAKLLLETGVGISDRAVAILTDAAFLTDVELSSDLAGLPRYLSARLR